MRPLLAAFMATLALAACDTGDTGEPDKDPGRQGAAAPQIDVPLVTRHLRALQRAADQNGGNRAAGTRGYRDSARYVASVLRDAGWSVRLERFRFPWWSERSSAVRLAPGGRLRRGRDFRPVIYSAAGQADGPLRPAGNACTAEALAGISVGDVALARPDGCLFRVKAANAAGAGAATLLIVDPSRRGEASAATLTAPGANLPVLIVRRALAARLEAGTRVRLQVEATLQRRTEVSVIGESRGAGRRVVMAGGHLDSVPAGPGINDNGSGVAALLAIAASTGPRAPGAPIRLAFWGAEEFGLYGSRHYVDSLGGAERRAIGAYLNLDMVGSPNAVRAVYSATQTRPRARAAGRRIARLLRKRVRPAESTGGASDHVPFAEVGIPVGGVFTGASERGPGGRPRDPCYHLRCDRVPNVDAAVLVDLAKATAATLATLSRQAK